jgi:hypothetical protein
VDGTGIGRRAILAGGLGALVAAAASRVAVAQEPDPRQGSPMELNEFNFTFTTTHLIQSTGDTPAFHVQQQDDGVGIQIITDKAPAVVGRSPGTGLEGFGNIAPSYPFTLTQPAGVAGFGSHLGLFGGPLSSTGTITLTSTPTGVLGSGGPLGGLGVWGAAKLPAQVNFSFNFPAVGVWGTSGPIPTGTTYSMSAQAGVGVWGAVAPLADSGVITLTHTAGVMGSAYGMDQVGVLASNPMGTALRVMGGMAVTTAGRGIVPAGDHFTRITDPHLMRDHVVLVNLMGNPRDKECTLHYVQVGDGMLKVNVTSPPQVDLPFNYLAVELVN